MTATVEELKRKVTLDAREASVYLGVSTDMLYDYANKGSVPAFRMGNRWKFRRVLLDAWMERQSLKGVQKHG